MYIIILTLLVIFLIEGKVFIIHPHVNRLDTVLNNCSLSNYCESHEEFSNILSRIVNDYSQLLLDDLSVSLINDLLVKLSSKGMYSNILLRVLSSVQFSMGLIPEASLLWETLSHSNSPIDQRTAAFQMILAGNGIIRGKSSVAVSMQQSSSQFKPNHALGFELLNNYSSSLFIRLSQVLLDADIDYVPRSNQSINNGTQSEGLSLKFRHTYPINDKWLDNFLHLLILDARGVIRTAPSLEDMMFSLVQKFPSVLNDNKFRFRLGIALAKIGQYELSSLHVSISASPWEAPLYKFRAHLMFPSIPTSVYDLAMAVDNFERQAEFLIAKVNSRSPVMVSVCNSLDDVALALHALPILTLTGYSAPRANIIMGHSPVAIPVLLSEVYQHMCPVSNIPELTSLNRFSVKPAGTEGDDVDAPVQLIRVGIVGGSFDSHPGRIVIGLMDGMAKAKRYSFVFITMCFPTPKDPVTNRILQGTMFNEHVNLSPTNKSQIIERILDARTDIIIFADANYDSRVFALAHERLAPYQIALWGWSTVTLGIPTIDYYIIPEPFLMSATCKILNGFDSKKSDHSGISRRLKGQPQQGLDVYLNDLSLGDFRSSVQVKRPQDLFTEQVVFLSGVPPLSRLLDSAMPALVKKSNKELITLLQTKFFLPLVDMDGIHHDGSTFISFESASLHYYVFPCSVKHLHPEFDAALKIILATDPRAVILVATVKFYRDNLPVVHSAVLHDLMHPAMPNAAIRILKARLLRSFGSEELVSRVRVLPPLDPKLFYTLLQLSIAVLDPFPVGMHYQILDAVAMDIPIVTAPVLQECTNQHAYGLLRALRRGPSRLSMYPSTVEEYAVFALDLQNNKKMRKLFEKPVSFSEESSSHGDQMMQFLEKLVGR